MIAGQELDQRIDEFLYRKELQYPELGMPIDRILKRTLKETKQSKAPKAAAFTSRYIRLNASFPNSKLGLVSR